MQKVFTDNKTLRSTKLVFSKTKNSCILFVGNCNTDICRSTKRSANWRRFKLNRDRENIPSSFSFYHNIIRIQYINPISFDGVKYKWNIFIVNIFSALDLTPNQLIWKIRSDSFYNSNILTIIILLCWSLNNWGFSKIKLANIKQKIMFQISFGLLT